NSDKLNLFKKLNMFFAKIGRFTNRILPKAYLYRLNNLLRDDTTIKSTCLTLDSFIGYKFFLSLLSAAFCIILIKNNLFMMIFAFAGLTSGFFAPDFLIRNLNSRRLIKMDKELPYIIDLLCISTLSGQNIYNSIKIVAEKYDCLTGNEFRGFLQQLDFGIGKKEAYSNILKRNNSDSFKSFIFILQQAESYGSSISELLIEKAEFLRFEILQNVEKKTRLISTKMLFPLIFLILPAFIMLVCGPLVYLVGKNMFLGT
ncbi:type II secretion system F family protein, partial [bacterium]|nr:type II secretion system F family protein [bacterium]